MSLNKFKRNVVCFGLTVCLFYGCNVDYAPSMVSTSIAESQKRGFFLFEYKIDSLTVFDKRGLFLVRHVWIEKSHTSTMTGWGKETFQTDSTLYQIVFELDQGSYFKNNNLDNWLISDDKGDLGGSENGMISINLKFKEKPERIRFQIDSLKIPGTFNHDRVKVAEFVLKKR